MGGGHDEREQTLNQLLVEMDGFEGNEGSLSLLQRTGLMCWIPHSCALVVDRQVVVSLPDIIGREQILKVHMSKVPLDEGVNPALIF